VTGRQVRLFNPRCQQWDDHFAWSDDFTRILGQTACGRATVEALRMNRPAVVEMRRVWREAGLHPPEERTIL